MEISEEPDRELELAIADAGCECPKLALREATTMRVRRSDLLDACFVVRHSDKLSGGALLAWIRNGGWPVSGIRTADQIRTARAARADQLRAAVRDEAGRSSHDPPAWIVSAVCAKRLTENNLSDQVTDDERTNATRLQRERSAAALNDHDQVALAKRYGK